MVASSNGNPPGAQPPPADDDGLVAAACRGDFRALSRLISRLDRRDEAAIRALYARGRPATRAHVVGITGAPGAGKSTLIGRMGLEYRRRGRRLAVLAVDPSSAISKGAILADRLRMGELASDRDVFIRSMATHGAQGGLSEASFDAIQALEMTGFDTVIVETVGVGQDEIDIAYMVDTTVVVSVPGLGDAVQAIKAGLIEMADIHAVNKADRPDAQKTVSDLKSMLAIVGRGGGHARPGTWDIPVLSVSAEARTGIVELVDAFESHRAFLGQSGTQPRRADFLERRMWQSLQAACEQKIREVVQADALQSLTRAVMERRLTPQEAAESLLRQIGVR